MEDWLSREFVTSVFSRLKKPNGMEYDEKTLKNYVTRMMTLRNLNLSDALVDPDVLYTALRTRYSKMTSVLSIFRPAGLFVASLNEEEAGFLKPTMMKGAYVRRHHQLLREASALRRRQDCSSQESKRV